MLDSMGFTDEDKRAMRENLEMADFVVIDDLDKAMRTKEGVEVAVFDSMLRERVQNNRPVLVTSNTRLEDLAESYSPAIRSLLREHCQECVILGDDYRARISRMRADGA
jgi:DNA replication protein DnaC